MPVRLKDIAKELNVSVVTVSKVLRGHSDISSETRERVLRRVKELNYHPNLAARGLVTGKTYMVGLVVPDLLHPFFAEIAASVSNRIRHKGYSTVIISSDEDPKLEIDGIESLLAHQVDGLILASTLAEVQRDIFWRIEQQKIPYVLVDRRIPGLHSNFVGVNDEEIGVLATEHLIQQGHRRIAHIRGSRRVSTGLGRAKGYLDTLARYGLKMPSQYVVDVKSPDKHGRDSGREAMQRLLGVDPRPDAVFCYNDNIAVGALQAILDAGLRVPADIALIGVANLAPTDMLKVPLSTIDQCSSQIGDRAARLLLRRMESKAQLGPARIYIPPRLIVRDSTAVPSNIQSGAEFQEKSTEPAA